MDKLKIITLFICIILSVNSAQALEGNVEYNSVNIDYSLLNAAQYQRIGNTFLRKAEGKNINEEKQKLYYGEALGAYITATEINPELIEIYGKIGYIYGKLKKFSLAKS